MADPILINQIISSLGLTGQEAKAKRSELEKLSIDELNNMIANIGDIKASSLGGFSSLVESTGFKGNVFNSSIVDSPFLDVEFTSQDAPPPRNPYPVPISRS